MSATRWIGPLVVALPTLVGFSCAHNPLVSVSVAESRAVPMHSESSDRYAHAQQLLTSLAADLKLTRRECTWALFPNRTQGPCVEFESRKEEGIAVGAWRNSASDTIDLVLVKSPRVFGKHSRGEVEEAFARLVVVPLTQAYGREAIHVAETLSPN